jgi:hypothetical protein
MNIENLTAEEQDTLFLQLKEKKDRAQLMQREAYEGLRETFMQEVFYLVEIQSESVTTFHRFLVDQVEGFQGIMAEYGHIDPDQKNLTVVEGDCKLEKKTSKVKKFDERADMAATRLIDFLKQWVRTSEKGTDDPMYQLAMMAIERNQKGDLDYKQVSNLYKLEGRFNDLEYSAIMELFRESHIIEGTATHYYFSHKDKNGVWQRIEVSFNKL